MLAWSRVIALDIWAQENTDRLALRIGQRTVSVTELEWEILL